MSGAGGADVSYASEVGFLGGVGDTPEYVLPGRNVQHDTGEITNNLLKIVAPDDPEAQRYIFQNFEGSFGVSWLMSTDEYHKWLFNNGNTSWQSGGVPSLEWYIGADLVSGNYVERQIQGWVPATLSAEYTGPDSGVRVSVSGPYAKEGDASSMTPGTITRPSGEVPGHGATLTVNGSTETYLQSCTLNIEQIARLIPGPSRYAVDAVHGDVNVTLDVAAIPQDASRLKRAYGSSTATEPQSSPEDGVTATLTFSEDGTEKVSYDMANIYPANYNWDSLVAADTDLTDPITYNVAGLTGSDPTV